MIVSEFSLNKIKDLPMPGQTTREWWAYLEFIEAYFKNRKIKNPIIVEIGISVNRQKRFYEELLGYRHIGIDKKRKKKPDILGDSRDSATVNKLKEKLKGAEVNLLFIDGEHSYLGVKKDYELFSPLVKNIIALHDVIGYVDSVAKFWNELMEEKGTQDKTFITIGAWPNEEDKLQVKRNYPRYGRLGVGIILMGD